jgi:ribosome-associated toxin RatA of RatAB toxin-antitoxin module
MMITHNEILMRAAAERCYRAAADVERWPEILSHYRWVRFRRRDDFGCGLVEMAARRMFGPVGYPVWWLSEMRADEVAPIVHYRHVGGVTKGMEVEWRFHSEGDATRVEIVHEWSRGPGWPLIGGVAANVVIGPVFIHHVAGMTLEGVKAAVEAQ